jgi:hypothetical protein
VNLSNEQRTRIRESVFSGRNVPRVDNVNFSLNVGSTIPSHVRLVAVPSVLIDIHPEWRGYDYFVVQDDVYIVDHDHHIVASVPVGASGARIGTSGGGSAAALEGPAQIREVQQVLRERGFSVEVDGVLGPRTRDALIEFQRNNGLEATGRIDSRTAGSLGINGGQQGGGTTGQGASGREQQGGQGGAMRNQQNGSPGQAQDRPSPAPSNADRANQSNTTGRGGATQEMDHDRPNTQDQGTGAPNQGSSRPGGSQTPRARSGENPGGAGTSSPSR